MKNSFLKTLAVIFFSGLFTITTQSAYAQTPTTIQTKTLKTERQDDRVASLKQKADLEIQRRISSLNVILTKLNLIKRLTTTQKSSFSSQIQAEITNLNSLKTKIDADTDIATLRTDVQSIITAYRVYAFFIPQLHILSTADKLLTTTDTDVTPVITRLGTRIQEAQTKGKDVTALQTALTDMKNKLADVQTQANNAITTVSALTPSGYPGNKTTLESARTMLQTARQDLQTMYQDARTIIAGLGFKTTPTNPSVIPTTP
jgi:hypothetical protein